MTSKTLADIITRLTVTSVVRDIVGLGPPVCEKCKVIARPNPLDTREHRYICPICGNTEPHDNAFKYNIEELRANEQFLKFALGIDDEDTRLPPGVP